MADMYSNVANKYRNSPAVVFLFFASLAMLGIGIWLFSEDTYSSKLGLEQLTTLGINVQIFTNTYWVMSVAPQIASIIFFYIYLSDTSRKWALYLSLICQAADFFADAWYRSDQKLFSDPKATAISIIITGAYFSIGSEVFISVGFGLVLNLFAPALQIIRSTYNDIRMAYNRQYRPSNNSNRDNSNRDKYVPNPFTTAPAAGKKPVVDSTLNRKTSNRPDPFGGGEIPGIEDFMPRK